MGSILGHSALMDIQLGMNDMALGTPVILVLNTTLKLSYTGI